MKQLRLSVGVCPILWIPAFTRNVKFPFCATTHPKIRKSCSVNRKLGIIFNSKQDS